MERELEVIFAQKRLRLTVPRRAVFTAMHDADAPLSIGQLVKNCPSIDRTSVYRTLELFGELGITKVIHTGWKQQYELTSPFKSHHHHLSCVRCGRLVDLHSHKFERLVASVAAEHDFSPTDHTFEIRGLCRSCR